jgi:hypothetical protein
MTWIQRPAVKPYIRPEATQLDKPLRRVVTFLAQALKRPKPEFIDIAMMWFEVIADDGRCDETALEAELTQRLLEQLVLPDPSPACSAVPSVPSRWSAANAHRGQSVI